jgi:predicted enzyme related to lactoylglutathione lyase
MGQPVVHFEILGKDGEALQGYYSELFGWEINTDNPMNYGVIAREGNTGPDGVGIGGGVAGAPEGLDRQVTVYVAVPDVEEALAKAESLGGTRLFGPDEIMDGLVLGQFTDPAGNAIGVLRGSG